MSEADTTNLWFVIIYGVGMVFLAVIIIMGAAIVFGSHDPETINNYKDCISSKLPPYVCDLMYPPLPIQGINWTMVPFP